MDRRAAFGSVVIPPIAGGLRADISIPGGRSGEFLLPAHGLHYLAAGRAGVVVDGCRRIVEAGTLLTLPAGPRRLETYEPSRMLNVALPEGEVAGRFAAEPAFLVPGRAAGRTWAERMDALLRSTREADRAEAVAAAHALRRDAAEERAGRRSALVDGVLDYLGATLDRAPPLSELGERFGYAPNHLNDVIRAATGRSLRRWSLAFRLEAARRALARRGASIAAVACAFGFEPPYFARRFTARYGLSPLAWRALRARATPPSQVRLLEEQVAPHGVRIASPFDAEPHRVTGAK